MFVTGIPTKPISLIFILRVSFVVGPTNLSWFEEFSDRMAPAFQRTRQPCSNNAARRAPCPALQQNAPHREHLRSQCARSVQNLHGPCSSRSARAGLALELSRGTKR